MGAAPARSALAVCCTAAQTEFWAGFRHHGSRAEPMRFIRLVLARNAVQVQQPEGRAARTRGEAGAGTVTF